jgi:hypothetical protein
MPAGGALKPPVDARASLVSHKSAPDSRCNIIKQLSRSSTDSLAEQALEPTGGGESDWAPSISQATTPCPASDSELEVDSGAELENTPDDRMTRGQHKRASRWKMHSMDLGEKKAIKKDGGVSVLAIVHSEREKWMQEKQEMEERLSELKARHEVQAKPNIEKEKEDLKKQIADLRKTVAERSRFGAWVCEKHINESDDDDDSEGELNEKEKLRQQLEALESKLRTARAKLGTSTSKKLWKRPTDASAAFDDIAPFKAGDKSGGSNASSDD